MTARWMSMLIWAAVLAMAVAWGLRLFTRATPVPDGAQVVGAAVPAGASLVRLLGTPPAQPQAEATPVVTDGRFKLVGVVAPRSGQATGLALISVDGKPARPVGVGREIEPGLRLLTVSHRQAELGASRDAPAFTLALPPVAEPNRGRPGETGMVPPPGLPPPGQPNNAGVMLRLPQMPGQVPGQMAGQMPGQLPGQLPGQPMPPGTDTPDNGNLQTR